MHEWIAYYYTIIAQNSYIWQMKWEYNFLCVNIIVIEELYRHGQNKDNSGDLRQIKIYIEMNNKIRICSVSPYIVIGYLLPPGTYPNRFAQTNSMLSSVQSLPWWQTLPQVPSMSTSTRPSNLVLPSTNLTVLSKLNISGIKSVLYISL